MGNKHAQIPILVTAASLDVLTDQIERLQKDLDRTRKYSAQREDEAYIYRRCLETLRRDDGLGAEAGELIARALEDRGRSMGSGGM